jgi:hypothetical protein
MVIYFNLLLTPNPSPKERGENPSPWEKDLG